MTYLNSGGAFLVEAILGLYIIILLIRFWMHWTHADFRNQIGQGFLILTNPVIYPFRNFISTNRGFAYVTLLASITLMALKLFLLTVLGKAFPGILTILILAIAKVIQHSIYIFIGAIIIRAISSWFMPQGGYNPVLNIVFSISEPLLATARKVLPSFGGLDLSPILAIIFLQLTDVVVVRALFELAYSV